MIYCLTKAHELGLITCTVTQSHNWVKSETHNLWVSGQIWRHPVESTSWSKESWFEFSGFKYHIVSFGEGVVGRFGKPPVMTSLNVGCFLRVLYMSYIKGHDPDAYFPWPIACVAWRFWLGALNNKGGQGQRYREEIGAGATWKTSMKINTSIKNGKIFKLERLCYSCCSALPAIFVIVIIIVFHYFYLYFQAT